MPPESDPPLLRPNASSGEDLPTQFEQRVADADRLLVLSDFDGTLSEITDEPTEATIRPDARAAIEALVGQDATDVGIVSGRALDDVEERVGLSDVGYAGNHGLEIRVEGETFVHPDAEDAADVISHLCDHIGNELADVTGLVVEDKGLTATVHYRMVAAQTDVGRIKETVRSIVSSTDAALEITGGHQILEVRPAVKWDKGRAVDWIATTRYDDATRVYRIYVGDDVSDEAAFEVLDTEESTLRVGESPVSTRADYRIPDPAAVATLFSRFSELRE